MDATNVANSPSEDHSPVGTETETPPEEPLSDAGFGEILLETKASLVIEGEYPHIEMTVLGLGKYEFRTENRGDLTSVYTRTITFTPY
jgi:hypothetical protein